MIKFLKKYHKWLGIFLTVFIVFFSISGIVLNHRGIFSGVDVSRKFLPQEYQYKNWNNAAVKGTEKISNDSILLYGNIGIWLTDSICGSFTDLSDGFPKGIDNKKISKIFKTSRGGLFAGSLFGLFQYNFNKNIWNEISLPIHEKRIVDIAEKGDTLLILSRSYLLKTTDFQHFSAHTLPEPEGYKNKTGLFKTLWMIHSGELLGLAGKIIVDLSGLIFIFLSISGLIYFINPYLIKRRKNKQKDIRALKKSSKWNLKWHNKIGWITVAFLTVTALTGMFLRPPLLIPIANVMVNKIPHSILDSDNPWFDKLRRIIYDEKNDSYIIATLDGIYFSDDNFKSTLQKYKNQPPTSIMGVNVFEQKNDSVLLVGSFSGLFLWETNTANIWDYVKQAPSTLPVKRGSPIGNHVVSGYSKHFHDREVYFDYSSGANLIHSKESFFSMPEKIKQQPVSLWNLALEFHTARIYQFLLGDFYILVIPLSGLFILFILLSGFVVWLKKHRKR